MDKTKCTAPTKAGKPCKNKARSAVRCGVHAEKAPKRECFTVTFGEVAENHVRMQKIGEEAKEGFTCAELKLAQTKFEKAGKKTEYFDLAASARFVVDLKGVGLKDVDVPEAGVLVVRDGVSLFAEPKNVLKEVHSFEWDTKALMYGQVRNKKARYNVCFDDNRQIPDYENGKGTVVAFSDVPEIQKIRAGLDRYLGPKASSLKAEGNYYYDTSRCYIGWHGDSERKIVVAARIGEKIPLKYRWFLNSSPTSEVVEISLDGGDIYVMSQKATGNDWKRKKVLSLRHAAGNIG